MSLQLRSEEAGLSPCTLNLSLPSFCIMTSWPPRQMFALLLGVLLALGISLSVVHASDMAVSMSMAPVMGAGMHDGPCCDGADEDGTKPVACVMPCMAPVLALPPQMAPMTLGHGLLALPPSFPLLAGRLFSPEPHPPRATPLG